MTAILPAPETSERTAPEKRDVAEKAVVLAEDLLRQRYEVLCREVLTLSNE